MEFKNGDDKLFTNESFYQYNSYDYEKELCDVMISECLEAQEAAIEALGYEWEKRVISSDGINPRTTFCLYEPVDDYYAHVINERGIVIFTSRLEALDWILEQKTRAPQP